MSAIASFYVIDDDKRAEAIQAARTPSKVLTKRLFGILPLFETRPDSLEQFLSANARELDHYPFSGYLLLDVEQLAPNTVGSDDEVGSELARILNSTFVSYRAIDAAEAIELLNSADFSEASVKRFLFGDGRDDDYPHLVAPIQQSVEHLKNWLRHVSLGKTGILSIG